MEGLKLSYLKIHLKNGLAYTRADLHGPPTRCHWTLGDGKNIDKVSLLQAASEMGPMTLAWHVGKSISMQIFTPLAFSSILLL